MDISLENPYIHLISQVFWILYSVEKSFQVCIKAEILARFIGRSSANAPAKKLAKKLMQFAASPQ
jgi:hypothetical protein